MDRYFLVGVTELAGSFTMEILMSHLTLYNEHYIFAAVPCLEVDTRIFSMSYYKVMC